tara:strand:+ start:994 stop:1185 length:192 start_codon:yes stop_codon:yes gene_type:complete
LKVLFEFGIAIIFPFSFNIYNKRKHYKFLITFNCGAVILEGGEIALPENLADVIELFTTSLGR